MDASKPKHEVEYGTKGCEKLTFQNPFPEEVRCVHCHTLGARLAFIYAESAGADEYICNLHPNDPSGDGFWPHDAAAFAIYLCRNIECHQATTKWNQG